MPSRKIYENTGTKKSEREFADLIQARAKLTIVKLPRAYQLDYAMVDEKMVIKRWLEIKCRKHRGYGVYKDLMLSYHKFRAGLELSRETGLDFLLAYQFGDQNYMAKITESTPYTLAYGGRSDRGDSEDQEPVALIPTDEFVKF